MVESGRMVPLVCEDRTTGRPVGKLDLHLPQLMRHTAMLGHVRQGGASKDGSGEHAHGIDDDAGEETAPACVWLSIFEGNTPAEQLYKKSGFQDSDSMPGWLQEEYVNEIFMSLKLD